MASNNELVVTMKLDRPYMVDAIFVLGENNKDYHLSEFYLYVGMSSDWKENTACPNGPFADPTTHP